MTAITAGLEPTPSPLLPSVVLNQYRHTSTYKDVIGDRYHFPNRYLNPLRQLPAVFVYYEPRDGGEQVYFGAGVVRGLNSDTEDDGHTYAEIDAYSPFQNPVSFYAGPNDATWEPAATMRNSVRRLDMALIAQLCAAGGVSVPVSIDRNDHLYEQKLQREMDLLSARTDALTLRKKLRLLEAYERPSWVTNHVKRVRGSACQLCGFNGFKKRDGTRYCEIHHLFHLSDTPPSDCLSPRHVVVLCANCHRRMHYAEVGTPIAREHGWEVSVDGEPTLFLTDNG